MGRQRRLVGLAAVLGAVLALSSCGAVESPARRDVREVESALRAAGLRVCSAPASGEAPADADGERAFVVALACGDEDDQAVVSMIAWPDSQARDAALRRFEVPSHPTTRSHGITWALGQFTVSVSGQRDDAVVARVADAMRSLGAA